MQTLPEILVTGREGMKLTLRQVEEATGISNAYLSQLENGKIKKPSANVLYKLAKLYLLRLEVLFAAAQIISTDDKPLLLNFSIGPYIVSLDEEQDLIEYLGYLRFRKKHPNRQMYPNS